MAGFAGMVRCGMEIIKLLKANIRHKKGAFKSVAALMAIIVLSFTVTVSNNDNIDRALERSHGYANTPTFNAMESVSAMRSDLAQVVAEHPEVERVTQTECVLSDVTKINGSKVFQTVFAYDSDSDLYRVFNENFNGYAENPEPLREGEIYLPYAMTAVTDAEIGSTVTLGTDETPYNFTVKGFIEEPYVGASMIGTKRVFVCGNDLRKMYGQANDNGTYKILDIGVTLADGADIEKVTKELDDSCGLAATSRLMLTKEVTYSYTKLYSETGTGLLIAFVILLVSIVIISMWHSISTSIEMEYINLGILKAQGFTSWKIRLVYIIQYLIAELLGSVIGLLLSIPLTYALGSIFQPITGLLTATDVSFLKCWALSFGIILLCIAFVILATKKVGRISPVRAISGGKAEVFFDSRLNLPVRARPLPLFLGLRQFTSRLKSYGGSILIVALLVYFMMTVIVLSGTFSRDYFDSGNIYPDITAVMTDDFDLDRMEEAEQTIAGIDPSAKTIFYHSDYIMIDGIQLYYLAYDKPDKLSDAVEGRMPLYANEVSVTDISSQKLGKGIGDEVLIGSGENARSFIITGIHRNYTDAGKNIIITADGLYDINGTVPMCYVEMSDKSLTKTAAEALDKAVGEHILRKIVTEEQADYAEGIFELIDTTCMILVASVFVVSILFSAVVISMICSKAFIRERTDIGILKALGFTAAGLRIQFALRFTVIAVIGSVLGGAASLFLTSPLLEMLMRMVGLTRIDANITLMTFIPPALAICGSFFLFAYIAARKIKSVEVRELISE